MQSNARISNSDLAKEVNMAPSAVLERVKKLEQKKVIKQYNTAIDPASVQQKLLAFYFYQVQKKDLPAAVI
jgi:Lrp/AsnC family leucine-responsive transcriptional regulator